MVVNLVATNSISPFDDYMTISNDGTNIEDKLVNYLDHLTIEEKSAWLRTSSSTCSVRIVRMN